VVASGGACGRVEWGKEYVSGHGPVRYVQSVGAVGREKAWVRLGGRRGGGAGGSGGSLRDCGGVVGPPTYSTRTSLYLSHTH
jgi:hypothetical protein